MKELSFEQMENVEGGSAASVMCNLTGGVIGGIWGTAISMASFGAAIPVGILAGAVISTAFSEMACKYL
jgi:outer membrane lipoprotein SlyB